MVGLAAAPLPVLAPHRPAWWSSPGLAVALGYVSAATAWPAVAGQAKGLWARAVLGATGFWTLSLVALLLQKHLLIEPPTSLRNLTSSPTLAIAAVWAGAAAILPLLVRGRNVGADFLAAVVWALLLALGTQYAAGAETVHGLAGAAALAAVTATLMGALKRQ